MIKKFMKSKPALLALAFLVAFLLGFVAGCEDSGSRSTARSDNPWRVLSCEEQGLTNCGGSSASKSNNSGKSTSKSSRPQATGWPIKYGQQGDKVLTLQMALHACGWEIELDGIYGDETAATVNAAIGGGGRSVSSAQLGQIQHCPK